MSEPTNTVQLSTYNNSWYTPGGSGLKRACWYIINALFFKNRLFPFIGIKLALLKIFGAKLGAGIMIKPGVNIKYPWLLEIGNHVWIGEEAWIDNLAKVKIGDNCCLSQGAMLLTGNHDYSRPSFDLIVKEIILEEGVWIGAKAVVVRG